MTIGRTTRCWGVAVAVGLLLPLGHQIAADQGTDVPGQRATSPASETKPPDREPSPNNAWSYGSAWTVPFEGDGPISLTFTPSGLILAGAEIPTAARALDDGRVLWTSKRQVDTAPAVAGDLLIAPSGGELVAIEASTGRDVWTAALAGAAQPPVAAADAVLVAVGPTLTARRASDGEPIWAVNLAATAIAPPAFGDALVIVALDDQSLAAFDRLTGKPVWREPVDLKILALAVLGDRVYASVAEGFACAHRIEHGRRDWCFPVRVPPIGAAVGDARLVFFAFLDNMVHVFDRRSGRRYLTPTLDALPAAGPTLTADHLIVPVVTGEFVLLGLRDRLTASRVSTPRAVELPFTRAAAVASDGRALAMAITSAGGRYSLVYFSRQATPDAPKTGDAEKKSDGTASGTPPARTVP